MKVAENFAMTTSTLLKAKTVIPVSVKTVAQKREVNAMLLIVSFSNLGTSASVF
jgi:hypothetical protein